MKIILTDTEIREAIANQVNEDTSLGVTKDDVAIIVNGRPVEKFSASVQVEEDSE